VESGRVADVFLRPRHEVTRTLLTESGFDTSVLYGAADPHRHVIELSYDGLAAAKPLLSRIARESGLDFSILAGSAGRLKDTAFGRFSIELAVEQALQLNQFLSVCKTYGVHAELRHSA
jgi:D-methionine transport system ATP-binding protein